MPKNTEDWNALLNSEVFCNYLKIEQDKKASIPGPQPLDQVLAEFEELQIKIAENPKLVKAFQVLQNKFQTDLSYRSQTDPHFVEAVLMLNLPEEFDAQF